MANGDRHTATDGARGTAGGAAGRARGAAWRALAAAGVLGPLLGACSSVPDAVNPAEWYRSVSDALAGESGDVEATDEQKQVAAEAREQDYPKLSEVPDRPAASDEAQRARIREGLVADRQRARYSQEVIERQGEPLAPLSEASADTGAAEPPARTMAEAESAPRAEPAPRDAAEESRPAARPAPSPAPQAPPPTPREIAEEPEASPVSVQEAYRQALSQRRPRAEARRDSRPQGTPPPNVFARMPAPTAGYETVIVSGAGVETAGSTSAMPTPVLPSAAVSAGGAPDAVAGGARPLSAFDPAMVRESHKVATIQFGTGSSSLSASDKAILRKVAALHREHGGTLRVIGHASSRTRNMEPVRHQAVNLQVSTARADSVARELMRQGVEPRQMYVGALSDNAPIYYEVMPAGEAGNRRAEVYLDF